MLRTWVMRNWNQFKTYEEQYARVYLAFIPAKSIHGTSSGQVLPRSWQADRQDNNKCYWRLSVTRAEGQTTPLAYRFISISSSDVDQRSNGGTDDLSRGFCTTKRLDPIPWTEQHSVKVEGGERFRLNTEQY